MSEDPELAFAAKAFREQALRVAESLANAAGDLGFDEKTVRSWAKGTSRPTRKSVRTIENWLCRKLGENYQPGALARLWYPNWDAPVPKGPPPAPPDETEAHEGPQVRSGRSHRSLTPLWVAGTAVMVIAIGVTAIIIRGSDRGRPDDPAPGTIVKCGSSQCVAFRVVETIAADGGRDEGLFVRACYTDGACERKALAALYDTVYGRCRYDGKNVEGITTWVEVPWRFVPGSVAADGTAVAAATGQSDPDSPDVGYVSARYLDPRQQALRLSPCPR